MKKILVVLMTLLSGCSCSLSYMSNEDIIKQTNICKENGFDFYYVYGSLDTRRVSNVICIDKEANKPQTWSK